MEEKLQLGLFFISGFLVSRLLIKARLPQRLVYRLLGRERVSLHRIIFYLIASSAFLSVFIPNALTVITILPVLMLLRRTLVDATPDQSVNIATLLVLAVIYGANIGGMGSLTATPANGILVTYLAIGSVPGAEHLRFDTWLVWGLPLVAILVLVAWGVLAASFRPGRFVRNSVRLPLAATETTHPAHRPALALTALFFVSSVLFSLLMQAVPGKRLVLGLTLLFTAGFIAYLFRARMPDGSEDRLLTLRDCYQDLPKRGLLFLLLFVILTGILALFGFQRYVPRFFAQVLPDTWPLLPVFWGLALVTSFSTELLSNTVVQIALFTTSDSIAALYGFPPLLAPLIITLSCTCAFMSPLATGVNGLAFGEVKEASLVTMLLVGVVMNILAAAVISAWVLYVVRPVIGV